MGSRGPVSIHAVDPRKQPRDTAVTKVHSRAPEKPQGLSEVESNKWDQLVATLEPAGLLAECDALTLELACRHYAISVQASQQLTTEGLLYRRGSAKHPAALVLKENSTLYLDYAKQLGLSFVARARTDLQRQDTDKDNPFD